MRECQYPRLRMEEKGREKNRDRKRRGSQQGREERGMMKNKANARVAASGQRSISLPLLQGLGGWRERQRVS